MYKPNENVTCTECEVESTIEKWDKETSATYGANTCLMANGEYVDEYSFTCPNCGRDVDGMYLTMPSRNK